MSSPSISVIIPTFNHAAYLAEAMQSVLAQSYEAFELIVVNDGSTDSTPEVVRQFTDRRIKYLEQENKGATAARNTGIRASSGDLIAFLDADDMWHPEKLRLHADFLNRHPEVGATYNARFEVNHSDQSIRELYRPPPAVSLSDLVLGFPFSPSDLVVRRDRVFQVNLFDEHYVFFGDDLDFFCRLALSGVHFARVDRALNYRRRNTSRVIGDLAACAACALRPLRATFADPRCPGDVLALHDLAYSAHHLAWAACAFGQGDTTVGQELLREAVRLNPDILCGKPCEVIQEFLHQSLFDESVDHGETLRRMLDQLPTELMYLRLHHNWAVGRGFLRRGIRAIMWNRFGDGVAHFERAAGLRAEVDERLVQEVTSQLMSCEKEFGEEATKAVLRRLLPCWKQAGGRRGARQLLGSYSINLAFQDYRFSRYSRVLRRVLQAYARDLSYLKNRGAGAILFRSIAGVLQQPFRKQTSHYPAIVPRSPTG